MSWTRGTSKQQKAGLSFGDYVQAAEELDNITAKMRAHPEVLLLGAEIYARAGKWDAAAELADKLTDLLPEEFEPWLLLAESLHRLARTEEEDQFHGVKS